ncbi:hypothetical protein Zmor_013222 [Zophobas morio]|uniref:Uncharacterized protein n=1 Tax=Zophobas morio TaxID=2755281 RepID=A0AA38MEZ8_9CUCU|nr:hypothetical protein Zmor_013222 [Zophobas morio]
MWGVFSAVEYVATSDRALNADYSTGVRKNQRKWSGTATAFRFAADECTRAKTAPPQTPLRDSRCSRHVLLSPGGRALLCPQAHLFFTPSTIGRAYVLAEEEVL